MVADLSNLVVFENLTDFVASDWKEEESKRP